MKPFTFGSTFSKTVAALLLITIIKCVSLPSATFAVEGLTLQQKIRLTQKQKEKEQEAAKQGKAPKEPELKVTFDADHVLTETDLQRLRQTLTPEQWTTLKQQSEAIAQQHQAINNEMADDKEQTLKELALLWQAAIERSGSVRYAIEKLSSKDATGRPVKKEALNRRLLQNLAQLGGIAGSIWTGTPAGLIGGAMAGQLLQEDNPTSTNPVSDTDMIILTKAINELQQNLMAYYYTYRYAREQAQLSNDAYRQLQVHWNTVEEQPMEEATRNALQQLLKQSRFQAEQADAELNLARQQLGVLVGLPALAQLTKLSAP